MSFEVVRYTPEWRASLVALLARVGTTQLSDEEFTWWFAQNPAGAQNVWIARLAGRVVGADGQIAALAVIDAFARREPLGPDVGR